MPAAVESYKKLIQAGDLPPLSQVGLEISRLSERDDLSAPQLARLISKDAALAAKVLRIANSPFYGLRMQVKTLDHAIVVLGQISIVSICAASTVLGSLKTAHGQGFARYDTDALRSHSVLTAIVARWMAQRFASPHVPVADSFLGGLLHDMGEVAISFYYGRHLGAIREYEQEHPDTPSYEAEHAVLGFDHQELGAEVLHHWHLPPSYIEMARHHHDATYSVDASQGMMVLVLQAADQLAALIKDGMHDVVVSDGTMQNASQKGWSSIILTIPGVTPGIVQKFEKDRDPILREARVMIAESLT